MPCSSSEGMTWSPNDAEVRRLEERVAELEQALCGLCQMMCPSPDGKPPALSAWPVHPQLETWFNKHRRKPGCEAL